MTVGADTARAEATVPEEDAGIAPLSVPDMIRRHHDALVGFLRRRLRVSEDADDVAQETYVRLLQYEGSREIRSPTSMLFRIAINVANDLGRFQVARRESDRRSLDDVDTGIEQLLAADARLQALADAAYAEGGPGARQRPLGWRVGLGLAASLLLVLVGARLVQMSLVQPSNALAYENTSSQRRTVTLEDGTQVDLDVGTRIEATMTRQERHIELLSGRALFAVTHDANRPFSVFAAGSVTTALGTHFQVSRNDEGVEVTLSEGSVVVTDPVAGNHWQERLHPGEQLDVPADSLVRVRRSVDAFVATSWSRGRLEFRSTPLATAVEEVNRYAHKKLRLGDPCLARLTVSGSVVAGDGDLTASAFAALLPVHLVDAGTEVILFSSHTDAPR